VIEQDAPAIAHEAGPFLKWAGGKQQLLTQLEPLFPSAIRNYYEPFMGSAVVFFQLRRSARLGNSVHLADNNADLVNSYVVVRDHVEEVIASLAAHERLHSREHYYRVRHQDRDHSGLSPVEAAARLIYLNRTCYNGLYRVNSRGHFNVPLGSYHNPRILFAEVFARLTQRGCRCMLSNSCTPFILALYQDFRIETVKAKRAINSKGIGRGEVDEVVVLSYDPAPAWERGQLAPAAGISDVSDVSDRLAAS
jgi:site-specific DNA-adenine methylase